MTVKQSAQDIRTLLDNQLDSEVTLAKIYKDLISKAIDAPERHSCFRCKYHNPLLCAVVPKRNTENFFASNSCTDWQKKD